MCFAHQGTDNTNEELDKKDEYYYGQQNGTSHPTLSSLS